MFNKVEKFETQISNFYNAPYAVATDCCTHALELCLRYKGYNNIIIPTHTYISVPFTLKKLNLNWKFAYQEWEELRDKYTLEEFFTYGKPNDRIIIPKELSFY